jgi:hypothetical protein
MKRLQRVFALVLTLGAMLVVFQAAPANAANSNTVNMRVTGYQTGYLWAYVDFYGPSGYYGRRELAPTGAIFDSRGTSFTGIPTGQFRIRTTWCTNRNCANGSLRWEGNGYGSFSFWSWYSQSWWCDFRGGSPVCGR